ncbi:hypothetical protein F2Q70_00035386 [Brassica cretica]|uniref:Uncharacterized protein n=1 Tax=Brassica cretica TaxID=69181 RepID=A0A8S9G1H3_BRACR|nr:hypothetical protein F2Q68_00030541 [Brassica cretica]KAF2587456.1 hypothetical protein F2Q70_00035386 [Brassica cretica]
MLMEKRVKEWIEEMEVKRPKQPDLANLLIIPRNVKLVESDGYKVKEEGKNKDDPKIIGGFKRLQLKVMVEQSRILPCYTRRP